MGMFNDLNWSMVKDKLLKSIYNNQGISNIIGWTTDNNTLQQLRDFITKYNISESTFNNIINSYKPDSFLGSGSVDIPALLLSDLQEMDSWTDIVGDAPELPNVDDYYQEALDTINKENATLESIYNDIYNNDRTNLEKALNDNNAMFNDYRNQLLTNEAMQQQSIAGATRYELDRQQRNAISRGASAAQRLVTNINTSLGLQAQSAQQALNTSNALAQNLLAQRQAQQGIRSDYMNAQRDDSLRRADLIKGNSERVTNYQNMKLGQAMDAYDIKNQAYNDRLSKVSGTNPWSSAWTSWYTKNQNSKTKNAI